MGRGCGCTMGHGLVCEEGYLCDSCAKVAELEKAYREQCEVSDNWRERALKAEAQLEISKKHRELDNKKFDAYLLKLEAQLEAVRKLSLNSGMSVNNNTLLKILNGEDDEH